MLRALELLTSVGVALGATQIPLQSGVNALSSLSHQEFTTLRHPALPNHSVRIKKTDFCDPTVNVYTGYLDVAQGARHLFFEFFESRNSPETDDVVMWINGGPGCSSQLGLLMELGPCTIDMSPESKGNGTLWNPHSWTERANVFFLDQPVGVGFSYADYGETIETTEDAAKDIYAFLTLFFQTFKSFDGRNFHLSGESYGGRYLPVFAAEVYDRNRQAQSLGLPVINLKSVIIGNGVTDFLAHQLSRYDIMCTTASLPTPPVDISSCVASKIALPRCEAGMRSNCVKSFDAIGCAAAVSFCESVIGTPLRATGLNVYDISKPCVGTLCYTENDYIQKYLDRSDVRSLLGVDQKAFKKSGNFSLCSGEVGGNFAKHLDKYNTPTQEYVSALLERGVKVLIYAGTYDWQCNWLGNHQWTTALKYPHHDEFVSQPLHNWTVKLNETTQVVAGQARSAGDLTFVTVYGAGHMVPHDKPRESLDMFNRWLAGGSF